MHIGIIGLGRMGMQIARRLHKKRFNVVAWNRSPGPRQKLQYFFRRISLSSLSSPPKSGERNKRRGGGDVVDSIPELVETLKTPRIIWLML
ncbi:MAG: hypothetical protein HY397_00145, partial [Candidatus Doudnabacteria bacterium]|nr:hypothetical protein [Candidatus Doudnabacteria bacterium]